MSAGCDVGLTCVVRQGHAGGCGALAVGPGGLHAASCGADGALRLLARSDEPLVLGDDDERDEGLATGERHVSRTRSRYEDYLLCTPKI